MNETVVIIDNHSGSHGKYVTECVEKNWDGNIKKLDLAADSVSHEEIAELMNEAADNVENWNVIALNLSFGGSITNDPDNGIISVNKAVRRLYRKGVTMTFSAGNDGSGIGVNKLSAHPLNMSIGALTDEGEIAGYSNRHPRLMFLLADGNYNERNVRGTSFSSPLVCGNVSSARVRLGINDLQLRTLLKNTSVLFTTDKVGEWSSKESLSFYKLDEDLIKTSNEYKIKPQTLITDVYEAFAGRNPDKGGYDYWCSLLDHGYDIEQILPYLANLLRTNNDWMKDECTVVPRLQSLYHLFLNREADESGIMHWVNYLQSIDENYGTFSTADSDIDNWKSFIDMFAWIADKNEGIHRRWLLDLLR